MNREDPTFCLITWRGTQTTLADHQRHIAMELRSGVRLKSVACDTEVIVVRSPAIEVDVRCGGHSMVSAGSPPPSGLALEPNYDGGTLLGKRYSDSDESLGLELLCTKAGKGALSVGRMPLPVKGARPLPASD